MTVVHAVNPPPSQIYYIPFPENDQLQAFRGVNTAATEPLAEFITFSTASDNTVIYYDHWEDGYEEDITNPKQSTTLVFGDGDPSNGFPPGNPGDLIPAGTVFDLRNFVVTTTLQDVLDYDARDKVASYKPIAITKTTYPQSTLSLLAGCFEIFEYGLWGTEYRSPIGTNLLTSVDADMFNYTSLSVMAGSPGTTVKIDADNNGSFEQTVALDEGGTLLVTNALVGARVSSDKPVQVVLFAGRPTSNYQSRDTSLTPTNRWSSSYYAPVSTPETSGTTPCQTVVFLYNPNPNAITVSYAYRSATNAYTVATTNVPAGTTVKGPPHVDGMAYHYYTTGANPPHFYAFCAVDGNSATVGNNQAWDGGFALIGEPSLTTQILLGLGIGRDPYSATNPSENGNPVYLTTVGNGHNLARVYVDFNGDNAGANTDPNGNKYDVHYDVRELDRLKLFDPDGNQSGMLVYTLDSTVKLAAAWAQDPSVAAASQPGLDVATAIPPLREGAAGKASTLAVDADGDGYHSAGDTLEYDIRVVNTARTPIPGPFTVKDTMPADTEYVSGTTRYRFSVEGVWADWVAAPDDLSGTPFPLDGTGYPVPGTLGFDQQIQVVFQAKVDTYANLDAGRDRIRNTGNVEVTPYGINILLDWTDLLYGSIGDRIWQDQNGDGVQDIGETGLTNVVVYLDLNSNGVWNAGEPKQNTTTNGLYVFNGLRGGSYLVRVDPSSVAALNPGYGPTYDLDGIATSYAASVTLSNAQDRVDVDFGFRVGASVGDRVWMDLNGNGVQNAGESGINGIRVYIDINSNGVYNAGEPNTITSGDGNYYIGNLNPGTYRVRVDTNALPAGAVQTYDYTSPYTDHQGTVTLLGAEHNANLDFGYRGSYTLGDLVWEDANGDGVSTNSITYNINNGRIDFNGDGSYNTSDDGYIGAMRIIDGYVDIDNDGSTPVDNGDDGTFLGRAIVNGGFDMNNDGTISGTGSNDDGTVVYTSSESGIPNVRVYIDSNGNGVYDAATEPSAITSASGIYAISNLLNGTYTVRVDTSTLPTSMFQTYDLTSPTDDDMATVVISGASRTDVDFGYRNDASVGDRVWNDMNNNGVQEAGEPGIAGVFVYIDSDASGSYGYGERYAYTDINGFYTIDNLTGGTYRVTVEIGTLPISSVRTYDLDGTNTANYASRSITNAQDAVDVDFGYRTTASLGDRIWNDLDGDGVQDVGEPGINGVRVFIDINGNGVYDAATEPAATTSGDGAYSVTGLTAGTYTVHVDPTTLPPNLTQTYDLSGTLDHAATAALAANQTRTDVDFGYVAAAGIGDRVWMDVNANGQQDAGEAGLDGVTVALYDAETAAILGTAVTSGGGNYYFPDLMPGGYYLVFGPLAGYMRTPANQGSDSTDSDAICGYGRVQNLILIGGMTNLTVDAGYIPLASVGDRVWLDENGDGIQDAGEDGIPNARVELVNASNTVVATTVTDLNGGYLFTRLPPGTYTVRVVSSTLPSGLAAHPTFDEDGVGSAHQSAVTVVAGAAHLTSDFGYNWVPPSDTTGGSGTGAIGDRLWIDSDGDGRQDPGEAGLGGIAVALYYDPDGNGIYDTLFTAGGYDPNRTTSADGLYVFDDLPAGAYSVVVNGGVTPVGYTQTGDPDDFGALAASPDNRTTTPVILAPGDVFVNADFGYRPAAGAAGSIGDRVWFDADADGVQDVGESGIPGVSVSLIQDANGNGVWDVGERIISTTTTGTDGLYLFDGLPTADGAGTDDFLVWVNDVAGLLEKKTATFDVDGLAPASGIVTGRGISDASDLTAAGTLLHDFGYTGTGHTTAAGLIGDRVWLDADGDGAQDAGEQSLGGVTVKLLAPNGITVLSTTVTDNNGNYWFNGLLDGTYIVRVDTVTLPNGGGGLTNTGDPDGGTPSQSTVTISGGSVDLLQDFGYQAATPNTVGGTIWSDRDADGTLTDGTAGTPNETTNGVQGVTVILRDSSGRLVGTTVTDSNGSYSFSGLPDGTYQVDVTDAANLLAGWWHSDGPSDGADNNSQPEPYTVSVSGGATNMTGDFGYYVEPAALGNFVWDDLDGDGIQDAGEAGISGVSVALMISYPNGTTSTVWSVTDANGHYGFGNLLLDEDFDGAGAGEPLYSISVSVPSGFQPTLLNQGADDAVDADNHAGQLASPLKGETVETYDFGFIRQGTLGDFVWNDLDGDGIQDLGEPGMTNVTVRLLDAASNLLQTAVTDINGAYSFTNLMPSTYLIQVIAPTGFVFAVRDTSATNDLSDSDADASGWLEPTLITSGQTDLTRDAGLTLPALIHGHVYLDLNTNLLRTVGVDYPIGAMTVTLWRAGVQVASTLTATDGSGQYEFNNLLPGDYVIRFSGPIDRLESVPVDPPSSTDPVRNRAAVDGQGHIVIPVSVQPGEGVLTASEPYNAGFVGPERPLSGSVLIRAYSAKEGVRVEFTTVGEMDFGMITAWVWLDGKWVELGSTFAVGYGSNTYSFNAPALKPGERYYFRVEDEVGYLYDLYGVEVKPFAMEMQLMDRTGVRLKWESIPGRSYEVYTTTQLGSAWALLETVLAEEEQTRLDVKVDPSERQRFFKIVMVRDEVIE